jgi:hypothetical protein
MDGDLAYFLEHLELLVEKLKEFDFVIGCRSLDRGNFRNLTLLKKICGKIFNLFYIHLGQYFVINFISSMPIYALFLSSLTMIVLQVSLIAAAGIVLDFLARHYLSVPLSVMIVASYYGANGVIGPTLGKFYEHCQIPVFIFSLLLA